MQKKINALVIKAIDTVAVAIEPLKAGDLAVYNIAGQLRETILVTDVPIYHKFAIEDVIEGEDVHKYGQVIGRAVRDIKIGEHIHTHNILSIREAIAR